MVKLKSTFANLSQGWKTTRLTLIFLRQLLMKKLLRNQQLIILMKEITQQAQQDERLATTLHNQCDLPETVFNEEALE